MADSLTFTIRRGDTRPNLRIRCIKGETADPTDNADAVDLTLATTVRLLVKNSTGLFINATMTKEDQTQAATKGYVNRVWQTADTATAGTFPLEVQVEWADGGIQTFPADRSAELDVVADAGP